MKKIVFFFLLLFSISSYGQIDFFELIEDINWAGSEKEVVEKFDNYIVKISHEEWENEESCADYSFKKISLADILIDHAPIRVKKKTKSLFRIVFQVFDDNVDASLSKKVDLELIQHLGFPVYKEDDEGLGIISTYYKEWVTHRYKVIGTLFVFNNKKYSYPIRVEPIQLFPVNYNQVVVEANDFVITPPLIESFIIDQEGNVYVTKEGGIQTKEKFVKGLISGDSISIHFDGGGLLKKKEEDAICYEKNGFKAKYPLKATD